jgi:hypothetical protein
MSSFSGLLTRLQIGHGFGIAAVLPLSPILILSGNNVQGIERLRKHTLKIIMESVAATLNLNREPFGRATTAVPLEEAHR